MSVRVTHTHTHRHAYLCQVLINKLCLYSSVSVVCAARAFIKSYVRTFSPHRTAHHREAFNASVCFFSKYLYTRCRHAAAGEEPRTHASIILIIIINLIMWLIKPKGVRVESMRLYDALILVFIYFHSYATNWRPCGNIILLAVYTRQFNRNAILNFT